MSQIGISSVWWEGNPCNMHLNELAAEVKEGVREAGGGAPAGAHVRPSCPKANPACSFCPRWAQQMALFRKPPLPDVGLRPPTPALHPTLPRPRRRLD